MNKEISYVLKTAEVTYCLVQQQKNFQASYCLVQQQIYFQASYNPTVPAARSVWTEAASRKGRDGIVMAKKKPQPSQKDHVFLTDPVLML